MKRISSKITFYRKVINLFVGILFLSVSMALFFSKNDDLQTKIIVSIVSGITGILFLWIGSKSFHVSLTQNGINIRGIIQSDDVMLNNLYDLNDFWFTYPHIAILKFNKKTKFGKVILIYPKRTEFIHSRTIGLDTLKRAIGK